MLNGWLCHINPHLTCNMIVLYIIASIRNDWRLLLLWSVKSLVVWYDRSVWHLHFRAVVGVSHVTTPRYMVLCKIILSSAKCLFHKHFAMVREHSFANYFMTIHVMTNLHAWTVHELDGVFLQSAIRYLSWWVWGWIWWKVLILNTLSI